MKTKKLNVAVNIDKEEFIGYWSPQSGINGIVVHAKTKQSLERKFRRAVKRYNRPLLTKKLSAKASEANEIQNALKAAKKVKVSSNGSSAKKSTPASTETRRGVGRPRKVVEPADQQTAATA